jgi:hypothetical protein
MRDLRQATWNQGRTAGLVPPFEADAMQVITEGVAEAQ